MFKAYNQDVILTWRLVRADTLPSAEPVKFVVENVSAVEDTGELLLRLRPEKTGLVFSCTLRDAQKLYFVQSGNGHTSIHDWIAASFAGLKDHLPRARGTRELLLQACLRTVSPQEVAVRDAEAHQWLLNAQTTIKLDSILAVAAPNMTPDAFFERLREWLEEDARTWNLLLKYGQEAQGKRMISLRLSPQPATFLAEIQRARSEANAALAASTAGSINFAPYLERALERHWTALLRDTPLVRGVFGDADAGTVQVRARVRCAEGKMPTSPENTARLELRHSADEAEVSIRLHFCAPEWLMNIERDGGFFRDNDHFKSWLPYPGALDSDAKLQYMAASWLQRGGPPHVAGRTSPQVSRMAGDMLLQWVGITPSSRKPDSTTLVSSPALAWYSACVTITAGKLSGRPSKALRRLAELSAGHFGDVAWALQMHFAVSGGKDWQRTVAKPDAVQPAVLATTAPTSTSVTESAPKDTNSPASATTATADVAEKGPVLRRLWTWLLRTFFTREVLAVALFALMVVLIARTCARVSTTAWSKWSTRPTTRVPGSVTQERGAVTAPSSVQFTVPAAIPPSSTSVVESTPREPNLPISATTAEQTEQKSRDKKEAEEAALAKKEQAERKAEEESERQQKDKDRKSAGGKREEYQSVLADPARSVAETHVPAALRSAEVTAKRASELLQQEKFREAAAEYQQAISQTQTAYREAKQRASLAEAKAGYQYATGSADLTRIGETQPELEVKIRKCLQDADSLAKAGQFTEAEQKYEEATRAWQEALPRTNKITELLLKADKSKESEEQIQFFTQVIELAPRSWVSYNKRGIAYHQLQKYGQAVADFAKVIDLKPDFVDAYRHRGVAYAESGEYVRALADLSKAIDLKPDYANAFANRGAVRSATGDLDMALNDLDRAIQLAPEDPYPYSERAVVHLKKGNPALAVQDCTRAMDVSPDYGKAYCIRAQAYEALKDPSRAWADVMRCQELGFKAPSQVVDRIKIAFDQLPEQKDARSRAVAEAVKKRAEEKIVTGEITEAIRIMSGELCKECESAALVNPEAIEWRQLLDWVRGQRAKNRALRDSLLLNDLERKLLERSAEKDQWTNVMNKLTAAGTPTEQVEMLDRYIKGNYGSIYRPGAERMMRGIADKMREK
jgi:tetratricopeptide (TPR) repeat protein